MAKTKIDKLPSLRACRKLGRLDGREGLPDLAVTAPHSPFLAELKSIGEQHISQVTQSLSNSLTNFESTNADSRGKHSVYENRIANLNSDLRDTEREIAIIRDDYRGSKDESASSRVSDRRYLTGIWYLLIVSLTVLGEVVITYPAFTELFQDTIIVAILATLAASAMTISYSHILGLSLKRNDDKKRRQPRWVMPALLVSSIPLFGLILSLSNVRARKFSPVNNNNSESQLIDQLSVDSFGSSEVPSPEATGLPLDSTIPVDPLADSGFGLSSQNDISPSMSFEAPISYLGVFLLFAFLQLALMAVATFASYHHFSNSVAEEEKLNATLTKQRKVLEGSISAKTRLEKELDNSNLKRSAIVDSHKAQVENIERKVLARAQAFWGANIRQRSDSPLAKSREFLNPNLEKPEWMED